MAINVATARGWITRAEAVSRLDGMIDFLARAAAPGRPSPSAGKTTAATSLKPHICFRGSCARVNISTATTPGRKACAIASPGIGATPNGAGMHAKDPTAFDLHVGFVDAPRGASSACEGFQHLLA
jgi:hypothetical protein